MLGQIIYDKYYAIQVPVTTFYFVLDENSLSDERLLS
jgi:hypothetical protein